MRRTLLIARREYLARVCSRGFVLLTLFLPLVLAAAVFLPTKLMTSGGETRRIAVVAEDDALAVTIQNALENSHLSGGDLSAEPAADAEFAVFLERPPCAVQRAAVQSGALDGLVCVAADASRRQATYYSRHASDFLETTLVQRALQTAFVERQLAQRGVRGEESRRLLGPVALETIDVGHGAAHRADGLATFLLPYVLLVTVYLTVLIYGVSVMRSVLEEKASRVVELLLGAVTPLELMAGKIFGVGAVGLTQAAVWAAVGGLLGAGRLAGHAAGVSLALFPLFFLLGYAMYASLYAMIGALCNSDEEAQALQFPVTLPLLVCAVCAMAIVRDPNAPLAFWLSLFPLTSPIVMYARLAVAPPPMWQIALSLGLGLAALYGLVWLSARIFRVGILMYGKRPALAEVCRWLRHAE